MFQTKLQRREAKKRTVSLFMAAGQLTQDCSHSFYVCWNFGLITRRLFPHIILASTIELKEPPLLVCSWAFRMLPRANPQEQTSPFGNFVPIPELAPLHLLPPLKTNTSSFRQLTSVCSLPLLDV